MVRYKVEVSAEGRITVAPDPAGEWVAYADAIETQAALIAEAREVMGAYFDGLDELLCNEGVPGWSRKVYDDADDRARAFLAKLDGCNA